ncbi:MAG: sulfotransferase [Methylacidiphilales bacterium]|nr:sulfotransferase [Candidatus Methylacidiphilales bacterium]
MIKKDGSNLVFIVGTARSGTTWLQRLVSSHPGCHTGEESHLFYFHIVPQLKAFWKGGNDQKPVGLYTYMRESEFREFLKAQIHSLLAVIGKEVRPGEYFIEKTPLHVLCLEEIRRFLPKAKIIHLVRDPRDVVASFLAASRGWGKFWAPRNSFRAASLWVLCAGAAREYKRKFRDPLFYELRYEDLLADTPSELRKIVDFIGLRWNEKDILKTVNRNSPDELRAGGGTLIPLKGQARKDFGAFSGNPRGFIRRAAAGGWKKDLHLLDKITVFAVAGSLLREYGYNWEHPLGSPVSKAVNILLPPLKRLRSLFPKAGR